MLFNAAVSCISLLFAVLVGGVLIALFGYNPFDTYGALVKGAFGTAIAFTTTLTKSVPLMLTGLAIAVAFKCSMFNIGAEGQLMCGAMAAAIVGHYVQLPAILHIPLTMLAAMAGGLLCACIPAVLWQKANVSIVISTIMFNYIGQFLVQFLIRGPFRGEGAASASHAVQATAKLPKLLPAPYVLNIGILIAFLMVVLIYFLLNKTSRGYEMRAVGLNAAAARVNGINTHRNMLLALLISGALAGLAGGVEVTGSLGKIYNNFSPGYGFNGIPVALMARSNPFAIILTALLIGSMRSGSILMQSSVGISQSVVDIIQSLILIFIAAEYVIRYYIKRVGVRRHGVPKTMQGGQQNG